MHYVSAKHLTYLCYIFHENGTTVQILVRLVEKCG